MLLHLFVLGVVNITSYIVGVVSITSYIDYNTSGFILDCGIHQSWIVDHRCLVRHEQFLGEREICSYEKYRKGICCDAYIVI